MITKNVFVNSHSISTVKVNVKFPLEQFLNMHSIFGSSHRGWTNVFAFAPCSIEIYESVYSIVLVLVQNLGFFMLRKFESTFPMQQAFDSTFYFFFEKVR